MLIKNKTDVDATIKLDSISAIGPGEHGVPRVIVIEVPRRSEEEIEYEQIPNDDSCIDHAYLFSFNLTANFDDGSEDIIHIKGHSFNHKVVSHVVSTDDDHVWTFEYTKEQRRENEAKFYYQLGLDFLLKQKSYTEAIKRFRLARLHTESHSLVQKINIQDAKAHLKYGQDLYPVAWKLEEDGKFQKAKKTFAEALDFFQKSIEFAYRDDTERSLDECKLKIDGNTLANEGLKLEKEFASLHKTAKKTKAPDMYIDARRTLEKAIAKYEEAIRTFEEGFKFNKKFEDCISLIQAGLPKLRDIKKPIEQAGLKAMTDHLKLDIGEIRNLKYV